MSLPAGGWSVGAVIALVVLVLVLLLAVLGKMEPLTAGILAGLAAARLT